MCQETLLILIYDRLVEKFVVPVLHNLIIRKRCCRNTDHLTGSKNYHLPVCDNNFNILYIPR